MLVSLMYFRFYYDVVFYLLFCFVARAILLCDRFFFAMLLGVHLDVFGNNFDRMLVIFRFT